MTTIAWDGTTLAADRQADHNGYRFTVTKIRRVGDALVGLSGCASKMGEFCAWLESGAKPDSYPKTDGDDFFVAIVIRPGPVIQRYERTGYPIEVHDIRHAIGSGRDFAAVAMHLGETSARAVDVAALFDPSTGSGVDTLTLNAL